MSDPKAYSLTHIRLSAAGGGFSENIMNKQSFLQIFFCIEKGQKCGVAEIQALYQARAIRYFLAENVAYGSLCDAKCTNFSYFSVTKIVKFPKINEIDVKCAKNSVFRHEK